MLRYFHCIGTSQPELPLPSVWERSISKVWFICPVSDISFSTGWIAHSKHLLLLSIDYKGCPRQGTVQLSTEGMSTCAQINPIPDIWLSSDQHTFQTNVISAMKHKIGPKANTNDTYCVSIFWNKSRELCLQMKAQLLIWSISEEHCCFSCHTFSNSYKEGSKATQTWQKRNSHGYIYT